MFDGIPDLCDLEAAPRILPRRPWYARLSAWLRLCRAKTRQRRALARLDTRLLADVGLTRADAARECAKPFWR
tara:strand:- start:331 stop:549 length:219 start_codon:yes stop_codon:yes gene_type:complete